MAGPAHRGATLSHDGLRFDVHEAGPVDGDPVVLLHGFPQDSTSWRHVLPGLHDAGLRTVAMDQRGYSPGARPHGRDAYRMARLVDDVVALLDDRGLDRAHVVGHDWGGAVAWGLAGRRRDRVASVTVLSTPHPRAMNAAFRSSTQALASWYMAVFQLPVLPELLVARTLVPSLVRSGLPREDAERYAARMSEPGALTGAIDWYRGMVPSRGDAVPACHAPATYVWGSGDVALRRRAADLTARYVRGPYRFEVLDAGHWLPETRAEQVAALVVDRVRSGG